MLFNSFEFIILFFPTVFFGFFLLSKLRQIYAAGWLTLASLFFYGYWDIKYIPLLLISIIFNYSFGILLTSKSFELKKKQILTLSVAINLLILCYYKYANFFVDTLSSLTSLEWSFHHIILPLGISFFTFTQIAFLVDCYQKKAKERNFIHYSLFVTYFPHLIAGPVLHHQQMIPQFKHNQTYHLDYMNISIGIVMFILGLFKKVILADHTIPYVAPLFAAANADQSLSVLDSALGIIAYTLQLYFDFSGYSDMAIGISLFFNVNLPLNFNSPYKAINIIDFWRRWHMTLSQFLRDYLYIPLGGNRKGPFRRYLNLWITMFLGGLWHGAGWTFILWGSLHGVFLIINHFWLHVKSSLLPAFIFKGKAKIRNFIARTVTFICVVIAWTFFRADSVPAALSILKGLFGFNGFALPIELMSKHPKICHYIEQTFSIPFTHFYGRIDLKSIPWLLGLLTIALFFPNTQELAEKFRVFMMRERSILKVRVAAVAFSALTLYILKNFNAITEFLYFQF